MNVLNAYFSGGVSKDCGTFIPGWMSRDVGYRAGHARDAGWDNFGTSGVRGTMVPIQYRAEELSDTAFAGGSTAFQGINFSYVSNTARPAARVLTFAPTVFDDPIDASSCVKLVINPEQWLRQRAGGQQRCAGVSSWLDRDGQTLHYQHVTLGLALTPVARL